MKHGQSGGINTIIGLVAVAFIVAIIIIGVVPGFRNGVFDFFKNLVGVGSETQAPSCATGKYPVSGIQDRLYFKIGENSLTYTDVTKTDNQNVELAIFLKSSCKEIEYQINLFNPSSPGIEDTFIFKDTCLADINTELNKLNKGKYYVNASCYINDKLSNIISSKFLCASGTYPKSGTLDEIGFKIGNNLASFYDVVKTSGQNVELAVILKTSCAKIEYNIFMVVTTPAKGTLAIDNFVSKTDCLVDTNTALNNLAKGKYYVNAFCLDNKGAVIKNILSKKLEVR